MDASELKHQLHIGKKQKKTPGFVQKRQKHKICRREHTPGRKWINPHDKRDNPL